MEKKSSGSTVKTKKRWKPSSWMVALAVLIFCIIAIAITVNVASQVSKPAGEKLFESFLSAAKRSDIEDYIGTFYVDNEDYTREVERLNNGVQSFNEFLNQYEDGRTITQFVTEGDTARSSSGKSFWASSGSGGDLKNLALKLELNRIFATSIKSYKVKVIRSEANYQEILFTVTYRDRLPTLNGFLPTQKFTQAQASSEVLAKFRKDGNKWHFASPFYLFAPSSYVGGWQEAPSTWIVPYKGGLQLAYVSPFDINISYEGVYDLRDIEGDIISIGDYAFSDCGSMIREIILSTHTKHIGKYAFRDCTQLINVGIQSTEGYAKTYALSDDTIVEEGAFYNCKALTSVQFPSINRSIEAYTFYNCSSLTSVVIPNTIGYIAEFAFYGASKLETAIIPTSTTAIGDSAFRGCTALKNITSEVYTYPQDHANAGQTVKNKLSDNLIRLGGRVFEGTAITDIALPDGITKLSRALFKNASSLSRVKFSPALEAIDAEVFYATAITEIAPLSNVVNIGDNAFGLCERLTGITWGSNPSIATIGSSAFRGCSSIAYLELPASIRGIGSSAFTSCTRLRVVMVNFMPDISLGENAFETIDSIPKLYVPTNTTPMAFISRPAWNGLNLDIYSQEIIDESSQMAILPMANNEKVLIQYLGEDTNVVLSPSLGITHIGDGAFSHHKTITKLDISGIDLVEVGADVFKGADNFAWDIYEDRSGLGGRLLYIDNWLFGVEVTGGVLGITLNIGESNASRFRNPATSAYGLPATIGIAASAFIRAEFKDVVLPSTLKYIGDSTFRYNSSLATMQIENVANSNLKAVGSLAFENCEMLRSVTLPQSLEEIGDYAFDFCGSLRFAIIGSEQVSLGANAFRTSSDILKIYVNGFGDNYKQGNWLSYASIMYDTDVLTTDGRYALEANQAGDGYTLIQYLAMVDNESVNIDTDAALSGKKIIEIGDGAFAKSLIRAIVISEDVEIIGQNAFFSSPRLTNVTFNALSDGSSNVRYIGDYAFSKCDAFNRSGTVEMLANAPHEDFELGTDAFDSNVIRRIEIPSGTRAIYEERGWKTLAIALIDLLDPQVIVSMLMDDGNGNYSPVTTDEIKISPARLVDQSHYGLPGENVTLTALVGSNYEFVRWEVLSEGGIWETPEGGDQISYNVTFGDEPGDVQQIRAIFRAK